jgi:hypothetical protein
MAGTKGFRYVYSPAHITNILKKIQSTGRPEKLNFPYMRDTWLLKNAQYRALLDVLRDMEFIDASGKPTELYARYQNPSIAKQALAEGVRKAYSVLFKAYPNAQTLTKTELEGYFRQQTGKTGSVLEKILSTFRTLSSHADFAGVGVVPEEPTPKYRREEAEEGRVRVEPKIQLNIEIHIAPDTPDDKIETIFKNMKQYLLPNE